MPLGATHNDEHPSSAEVGGRASAIRSGELQPEIVSVSGGSRLFRKHKNIYMRNKQRRRAAANRAANSTNEEEMKQDNPSTYGKGETCLQQPTLEEDRPATFDHECLGNGKTLSEKAEATKGIKEHRIQQHEAAEAAVVSFALRRYNATLRHPKTARAQQQKSSTAKMNPPLELEPPAISQEATTLISLAPSTEPKARRHSSEVAFPSETAVTVQRVKMQSSGHAEDTVQKAQSAKRDVPEEVTAETGKMLPLTEPEREPEQRKAKPPPNEKSMGRKESVSMGESVNGIQSSARIVESVGVVESSSTISGNLDASVPATLRETKELSSESRWRRHGELRRRLLLKRDREMGGTTFVLNRRCPIERYYEVANRVMEQFRAAIRTTTGSSPTEDKGETTGGTPPNNPAPATIEETFLMGHRLVKFLEDVLPTHADYFSHRANLSRLRLKSRTMLEKVRHDLALVELRIDRLEANKFILSDLKTQKKKRKKQKENARSAIDDALDDSRSTISATSSQGSLPSSAAAALGTSAGSIEILVSLAELEAKGDKNSTELSEATLTGSREEASPNEKGTNTSSQSSSQSKQALSSRDAAVDRWRSKGRSRNLSTEKSPAAGPHPSDSTHDPSHKGDHNTHGYQPKSKLISHEAVLHPAEDVEERAKCTEKPVSEVVHPYEEPALTRASDSFHSWCEKDFASPTRSESRKQATSTPTKEQEALSLQPSPTSVLEVLEKEKTEDDVLSLFPSMSPEPQFHSSCDKDGKSSLSCWDEHLFGKARGSNTDSTLTFSDVFVTDDGFPAIDTVEDGDRIHEGTKHTDSAEFFQKSEQLVFSGTPESRQRQIGRAEDIKDADGSVELLGKSARKGEIGDGGLCSRAGGDMSGMVNSTVLDKETPGKVVLKDQIHDGSNDSAETTSTESSTSLSGGDGSESEDEDDDGEENVKTRQKGGFDLIPKDNPPSRRRNVEGLTFLQRVARENFTRGVLDMLAEEDSDADDSWAPSSEHNYLVGDYVGDGDDQATINDDVVEPNLDTSSVTGFSTEASEKLVGAEIVSEGSVGDSDEDEDEHGVTGEWISVNKSVEAPSEIDVIFPAVIDGDIDEQSACIVHDPDLHEAVIDDASTEPTLKQFAKVDTDDASADVQNASIYTDPTIDLLTNSDSHAEDESTEGGSTIDEDEHANFEKMIRMEFGEMVGEEATLSQGNTRAADVLVLPMQLHDDSPWTPLSNDFQSGTGPFSAVGEEDNSAFPFFLDMSPLSDASKAPLAKKEEDEKWAKFSGFPDVFGLENFSPDFKMTTSEVDERKETRTPGDIIQRKMVTVPDKLDHLELRMRALQEGRRPSGANNPSTSGGGDDRGFDFFGSTQQHQQGKFGSATLFLYEPEEGEDEV